MLPGDRDGGPAGANVAFEGPISLGCLRGGGGMVEGTDVGAIATGIFGPMVNKLVKIVGIS